MCFQLTFAAGLDSCCNVAYLLFVVDVYICGGYNGDKINDDLWKLNLSTMRWQRLPATMPEPAYFHSVALTEVSWLLW